MSTNTFINIAKHDFYTAMMEGRGCGGIIRSRLKPKPYKEHRELTRTELAIYMAHEHFLIMLMPMGHGSPAKPDASELAKISVTNCITEDFPELAAKHNLAIDRTHEFWRKA